ncbi:MAG: TolC family protein [Ferruginibacter sp.]
MLGLSEQTELDPDSTDLLQINEIKSFDQYEQSALQSRKDIQALSIRTKAANVGIKSAKSEYYPSIAITGGYAALYIPNFVTLTNAIDIGVGVSYSLSSLWKQKLKYSRPRQGCRNYKQMKHC